MELVRCPNKLSPAGEVSQNVTANQIQLGRKCGSQNGFCHLGFGISLHASARRPLWFEKTNGRPTKRIVRVLTTESAAGGRPTYEKEMLNSRKNSHFCKTNHPGFAATVCQPSRLAKTDGNPTKRIVCTLTTESAGDNRPAYEKESSNSRKTSHSYKTNHPGFTATVAHATSVKWDILER